MAPLQQPTLEKRTHDKRPLFFVRTVSGWMVSRPLAVEALTLFEEQEAQWKAKEVVRDANPRNPAERETPELVVTARASKE